MFCVALVVHTNSIDSRIPNWNIYYHKIASAVQDLRFLVTVWIHGHWQRTALHVTCLKLLERTNFIDRSFCLSSFPTKKYVHRPWQSIFLVDCSICELSVIVCISFVDISWMKCIKKENMSLSPKIIKYINFWSWLAIVFFCLHQ